LPLAFRHTWASWAAIAPDAVADAGLPALEITPAAAAAILGTDVLAAAAAVDKSGKPPKPVRSGRTIALSSASEQRSIPIDNIAGILRGTDPKLAEEYVVVGAHYDHVGVDTRGRVGCGADDNASGTAAMLEIVSALAAAGPRRSILACAFAAEEDGLLGSKALCDHLPVPRASIVAMINLDMVGRGEVGEVAVLGLIENPKLEDVLERAKKLGPTKIKSIVMRQGQDLFARSDHYSFHQIGVPVLFFFEGLPIDKNKDYHTWRDTIDQVDTDKVARTAKLVFNAAWLLADDDERPPKPEKAGN
jgi:Zn-dependent M28 family amino/carboxypeptidase